MRKIKGKLLNLCVTYLNGAEQSREDRDSDRDRRGVSEREEHFSVQYLYRAKR